jgi:hypothetical protein
MERHPLGRIQHHDPLNRLPQHRALVSPPPRSPKPYPVWYTRDVFDQGQESSCTAQAAVGLLRTSPHRGDFVEYSDYDDPNERYNLYRTSQDYDPWEGNAYEGTSTDAPFKVLRERTTISSWKWLFGEAQVREWLTWFGPCAVGTVWLDGMFDPDERGYLRITGQEVGGHAYRIVQYSPTRRAYRLVNSWGRQWGENGRAWLREADLAGLLEAQGEAVVLG